MIKRLIQNLFLFLVCVGIFSSFLEIGIRLLNPQKGNRIAKFPPGTFIENKRYGIRLSPNFNGYIESEEFEMAFRTNSLGFRGDEIKEKSDRRIVCLGDSMTFGYGVNDENTFCSKLSEKLDTETLNIGIPGYDIDRYLLLVEDVVVDLRPEMLILFFTISNDFGEIVKKGEALEIEAESCSSLVQRIKGVKIWLFKNSHLCLWIKSRLDRASSLNMLLLRLGLRSAGEIYLKNYTKVMDAKVERARLILQEIKKVAEKNNFKILVVAIPDYVQIARELRLNRNYWDLDKPNRILKSITNASGIEFFDLLALFKRDGERFYYPIDGHLNDAGHNEIARAVFEYLMKNK